MFNRVKEIWPAISMECGDLSPLSFSQEAASPKTIGPNSIWGKCRQDKLECRKVKDFYVAEFAKNFGSA